jgi:hypothetical protein
MATDHKSQVVAAPARVPSSAAQEDDVYGMLGALLGTLEVVATDDAFPLATIQAERLRSAVRLCHGLQHQIEALLTLASEHLGTNLRCNHVSVRALVEHAVRGAVRGFAAQGVQLRLVPDDGWERQRVFIDSSRVDRMLKALAETLAASVGQDGVLEASMGRVGRHVRLALIGHPGSQPSQQVPLGQSTLARSQLLTRGAARLFELHGGGLAVDAAQLHVHILLPASEEP